MTPACTVGAGNTDTFLSVNDRHGDLVRKCLPYHRPMRIRVPYCRSTLPLLVTDLSPASRGSFVGVRRKQLHRATCLEGPST